MGKLNGFREFQRELPEKRPIKERINDYKELYKNFPEEKLINQAGRCMDCGTPFCNWGCPLGNLAPDWNDMVYKGEWEQAYKRLVLTSSFPEFTGRICPALCEGACTLGINRESVTVREIELAIIEKAYKEGLIQANPPKVRSGKKVAVIGSGPAGLAAAAELNSVGHFVTVLEREDEIGGLLRYGIPDFKLEKNIIERRVKLLEEEGIVFKKNTNVGVNYDTTKLLQEFDAVVLAAGSTVPRDLKIEGRELGGVYFAMEYLTQQNRKNAQKPLNEEEINAKDKVVVVIGGGDTGSDCIGTAVRQGAKAVYQYEILPKPPVERDKTMPWPTFPRTLKTTTSHEEGCTRNWCIVTKKFSGENGKLNCIRGAKVEWLKDANGNHIMKELEGTEFEQAVDLVFLAMGFLHPEHIGMVEKLGVELDDKGNVKADENHMTSKEGIFTAGDMRRGQSLVVWAINDGRQTAKEVDKYLMGETSLLG